MDITNNTWDGGDRGYVSCEDTTPSMNFACGANTGTYSSSVFFANAETLTFTVSHSGISGSKTYIYTT